VGVALNLADRLPATELHQGPHIAVRSVEPGCPGVPEGVRRDIGLPDLDLLPLALDLAPALHLLAQLGAPACGDEAGYESNAEVLEDIGGDNSDLIVEEVAE
jgi:hypothetical protein